MVRLLIEWLEFIGDTFRGWANKLKIREHLKNDQAGSNP